MEDKQSSTEATLPQVDLVELVNRVKGRWRFFLSFVIAGAIGSVLYTTIAPPIWKAEAVLYFPVRPVSLIANLGSGGSGGLSSLLSGGTSTSLEIFRGFLSSDSAMEKISSETGLRKRDIQKYRRLDTNPLNSQLTISSTSSNKDLALKVVQANMDALSDINSRTQGKFSQADVVVINHQVSSLQNKISDLEAKMLAAEEANPGSGFVPSAAGQSSAGQISPAAGPETWAAHKKSIELELAGIDAKIQATQNQLNKANSIGSPSAVGIPSVIALEPSLIQSEADYKVKSQYLGPKSPEILQLKARIQGLKQQIAQEVKHFYRGVQQGVVDAGNNPALQDYTSLLISRDGLKAQYTIVDKLAKEAPKTEINLANLTAQLTMNYDLLGKAKAELLMATAQEMHDPVTWNVLDSPYIDDIPVNKHWLRNLADGLAIGILIGFLGAIRKPIK